MLFDVSNQNKAIKTTLNYKFPVLVLISMLFTQSISAQNWIQIGADIDGEAADDLSGYSVSLSSDGSTIAIGSIYGRGDFYMDGHVRVFKNNQGSWKQVGKKINGRGFYSRFGHALALNSDGSIVAIGATEEDGGYVRVYENINGTWSQLGSNIYGEARGDESGSSVSLSSDGRIVAIGAPKNSGNGVRAGHVRIYKYNNGTWTQLGSDIDGETQEDESGSSVSLSSDGWIVAIGAPKKSGNGVRAGHVRIYKYNNDTWTQIGSDIDGEARSGQSGFSVSLSSDGQIVAIGAPDNDGNNVYAGHVRILKNDNGAWTQIGSDIDGEARDDLFGRSVSLSSDGMVIAIGAMRNDGNGNDAGRVKVFKNNNGEWTQVGSDIDGEAPEDWFGNSISMSSDGSVVAIGAMLNDGNGKDAGHARVFCILEIVSEPSDAKVYTDETMFITKVNDTRAKFQWQLKDGTGWRNLVENNQYMGVQTDSLIISDLIVPNNNQLYRCLIFGTCMNDTTREVRLTICNRIVSQPSDTGIFSGSVLFNVTMHDTSAEYLWQTKQGTVWVDIAEEGQYSNVGSSTLVVSDINQSNNGQLFRCIIKGNCRVDTTREARINVLETSAVTIVAEKTYIATNPVAEVLTLNGFKRPMKFYITDLSGKEILAGVISNGNLDVRSLQFGVYFLKLEDQTIRFVKE